MSADGISTVGAATDAAEAADRDAHDLASQRMAAARSVTRDAIVDATNHLLMHDHPATLSIPAVAEQAGVSVRTVYRYFPTKQALVDEVAFLYTRQATGGGAMIHEDLAVTREVLIKLWKTLAQNLEETRAQHHSPAGRELRNLRLDESRAQMLPVVAKQCPDLPAADQQRLTDAVIAITSSSMFLELSDHLGHAPSAAANLAFESAIAVVNEANRKRRFP